MEYYPATSSNGGMTADTTWTASVIQAIKVIQSNEKCLQPTQKWTSSQVLWVIQQTLVNGAACFVVNFAMGTLMFDGRAEPTLWRFPTPLAASYALTIAIETVVNWFLSGFLMTAEVSWGRVAPINGAAAIPRWPAATSSTHFYLNLTDMLMQDDIETRGYTHFERGEVNLQRSLPWVLYGLLTMWPLFVLITNGEWGNGDIPNGNFTPELLCATVGCVTALITTPLWAVATLGTMGERMRRTDGRLGMIELGHGSLGATATSALNASSSSGSSINISEPVYSTLHGAPGLRNDKSPPNVTEEVLVGSTAASRKQLKAVQAVSAAAAAYGGDFGDNAEDYVHVVAATGKQKAGGRATAGTETMSAASMAYGGDVGDCMDDDDEDYGAGSVFNPMR